MSRGRIRERGGNSLDGEGVRAAMFPKEEKEEGKGGVRYRSVGEDAEKRGSAQCTSTVDAA